MKRAFMKRMSAVLAALFCLTLVLGVAPAFAAAESPAALKNAGTAEASFTAAPSIKETEHKTESGDTSTEPLSETNGELLPPTVNVPDISENENGIAEENTQTGSPSETDSAPADNASADDSAVTDVTEESGTGTPAVSPNASEPATVTFHNELKKGSLKITKTSENGLVEGLTFHLYGTSLTGETVDLTTITNAQGIALFENVPISGDTPYIVEEVGTPNYFIVPASQNVEIEWNTVTDAAFYNALKKGSAKVIKTAEYGSVEGLTFRLYGTSDAGQAIDMTAVTDAQGNALFENVPIGTYTVEEINTPDYYIAPASQQVTVTENGTAEVSFNNALKKGAAKVIKTAEYGSVEGLTFRLYGTSDAGQAIDMTAVTDAQGNALFENIPIGTYTVEEINTPDYYIAPAS